ncbi:MerR family transcriptional regulator [Nonomuraea sp. NPDC049141]|uniref:MerR family transcriptional regulator n=1 Tax=Nonomuraea sp. NPDC049141 TaxID=3155500 RepID=UPI0033C1CEB8
MARDGNGHRVYDAEAVRRLVFLTRMRRSGMPMRDLQHYISLSMPEGTRCRRGSMRWSNIATPSAAGSVS